MKKRKKSYKEIIELIDLLDSKNYNIDVQIDLENDVIINLSNHDKKMQRRIKKDDN